ncbi:MAG: tRNA (guanosine(37)-N1)-methyltransferase TrmD [Nocardioides sp.]|uniref:tRNA (guanosine(37)-N1)-methyltransferase TrmD n=1 Tax=Nocardioides sp. TaxID=35761 RepID=UPI0023A1861C|nr:tRNA (guanosine(37)-N1)-methyltransferase TrmD [Nocardioides sp.]MDE0776079.1 tRNA (guanosine(37)-N1)-methyltransferase TrmD [Nocardioides sp.]
MRLDYLTIFPDFFAPLSLSLPGKAVASGLLDLHVHDLREWTHDRHRTVDDTPYGGGAGMVMKPEPWGEALDALLPDGATLVVPTPSGTPLRQRDAADLATRERLVFACGRYEGIDQRVLDHAATRAEVREVSLGDYVLNGGEVAALVITEAVVRLLPGFMGNAASLAEESHHDSTGGLLEYPIYTKPASWRGHDVPSVLLSGDHAAIAAWRHEQSVARTVERRPDLLPAGAGAREWEIVPAVPADAGELLTLQRACWMQEAAANDSVAGIPALQESLADVREWLATWTSYVVRVDGRLVGAARGRLVPHGASGPDGGERAWDIGRIMVAPDLQGRGLGRVLLEHIQDVAPSAATSYVLFTGIRSEANLRMYKKAGFRLRRDLDAPPLAVVLTKPRR